MPPFKPRNGCIPVECLAKADLASNCVRIIMSGKLTGRSCLRVFIYFILIVERSELWSVWMRMMQARLLLMAEKRLDAKVARAEREHRAAAAQLRRGRGGEVGRSVASAAAAGVGNQHARAAFYAL
jgi:hypothetical protein